MTRPPDPLTVRLRWWAQVPQEEVEVYLALRGDGDGDEVIWAEGGRRLLSDWGWAAPDWPVGVAVDTEAYIVLPPHLPLGPTASCCASVACRGCWASDVPTGALAGRSWPWVSWRWGRRVGLLLN